MANFQVLKGVEAQGNEILFLVALPPKEMAMTQEEIQGLFWNQMDAWVKTNGDSVAGKTIRFDGAMLAATMGTVAGGLFYELRVLEVFIRDTTRKDPNDQEKKFWTLVLNKERRPWSIRPGQVVKARAFGHEVPNLVVRAASLGQEYQLCQLDNKAQVWIGRKDIIEFTRWLSKREEAGFSEQPQYRKPSKRINVEVGNKVRFFLFGNPCVGMITAVRRNSVNIVEKTDNGNGQVAVLVPIDDVKEVLS